MVAHSGNEYTEREAFGKQSEVQSFNGTEAELETVGRGDTAAKRQASYSGALSKHKAVINGRRRGGEKHM